MGITNNAEEFLLRILNFEIVFEFAEKTDYLFLYKIKECIKHSECPEGAYLSEVANYMDLSMPATSKMITNLEKKGYIIWKLDEKKEQTYIVLTSKAIELTNCEKNKIISIYDKVVSEIDPDDLETTRNTLKKIRQVMEETK